jgi:hypothetical protein
MEVAGGKGCLTPSDLGQEHLHARRLSRPDTNRDFQGVQIAAGGIAPDLPRERPFFRLI